MPVVDPEAGIDARYSVSHVCPPGADEGTRMGIVRISLPLTTSTSRLVGPRPCPGQARDDTCDDAGATCSVDCAGAPEPKGGINQWCCSNAGHTPCFPTAVDSGDPNHAIVRSGAADAPQPAWPDATYPKAANEVKMVGVFCLPSSGSSVIDAVTGSPGPGALILNGTETWLAPSSCP